MANYDIEKNVYVIVHGQKQLYETVKSKIAALGFKDEKIIPAEMDKPGTTGDFIAMIWPPMDPKEIILSEIINFGTGQGKGKGAWASINKNELQRISLN